MPTGLLVHTDTCEMVESITVAGLSNTDLGVTVVKQSLASRLVWAQSSQPPPVRKALTVQTPNECLGLSPKLTSCFFYASL